MSSQVTTPQPEVAGFATGEPKKLPRLGCIGRVSAVGDVTETGSGNYLKCPIEIEGLGASRSQRVYFLYRPEWLNPKFDPDALLTVEGGEGLRFVYDGNINAEDGVSLLQGLTGGTRDGLNALATKLFALPVDAETGGPSNEDVAAVLQEVLISDPQVTLGYILKQQQKKAGVNPETGKTIYRNTPFYEVDRFFIANDKGRKQVVNQAAKAAKGTFFIQFTDEDMPV